MRRFRKIGKMRRKKQKRLLIVSSISLLLFLCVGYAAFSTQLSLKAKGNIKQKTLSSSDLIKDVVDSGDPELIKTAQKYIDMIDEAFLSALSGPDNKLKERIVAQIGQIDYDAYDGLTTTYKNNDPLYAKAREKGYGILDENSPKLRLGEAGLEYDPDSHQIIDRAYSPARKGLSYSEDPNMADPEMRQLVGYEKEKEAKKNAET